MAIVQALMEPSPHHAVLPSLPKGLLSPSHGNSTSTPSSSGSHAAAASSLSPSVSQAQQQQQQSNNSSTTTATVAAQSQIPTWLSSQVSSDAVIKPPSVRNTFVSASSPFGSGSSAGVMIRPPK